MQVSYGESQVRLTVINTPAAAGPASGPAIAADLAATGSDTAADMQAGQAAGVRTVACLWGVGGRAMLARHRPWRVAAGVGELDALLIDLMASPARDWPSRVSPGRPPRDGILPCDLRRSDG